MSPLSLALVALSLSAPPASGDWPQWRGVNRDGISLEQGLLKTWPKDGPKLLWTYETAGIGYSSSAIVGNHLFTMGSVDDKNGNQEFVLAIDTATGKKLWQTNVGSFYKNDWGGGPRGTPTVDGEFVYTVGGAGDLVCLEKSSGKVVWQKSYETDFKGKRPFWGFSESVLIDGDHLIGTPGGADGAIIALNKKTGETVWRSTGVTDAAEYVSPVIMEVGGVRQYVTMFKSGTVAVRAKDGKRLWSDSLGGNETATIPTPIIDGDLVYVTSHYTKGSSGLLKISGGPDAFTATRVYVTTKILKNHHGGVVKHEGYLYGHTTTERGAWVCVDYKTGEQKWRVESNKEYLDKGSITYADGSFYCLGEQSGVCVKISASPEGWKEEARLTLPKTDPGRSARGGIWPHPVIAHGKLYLRDQNFIFCFDVKAKQ